MTVPERSMIARVVVGISAQNVKDDACKELFKLIFKFREKSSNNGLNLVGKPYLDIGYIG